MLQYPVILEPPSQKRDTRAPKPLALQDIPLSIPNLPMPKKLHLSRITKPCGQLYKSRLKRDRIRSKSTKRPSERNYETNSLRRWQPAREVAVVEGWEN